MLVLLPELWVAFVQPTFILINFLKKRPADSSARHGLCLGEMCHWVILTNPNNPTAQWYTLFYRGNPLSADASSTAFLLKLSCNLA